MTDAYIAASLEDEKAKEIGQIIANDTTRKILNLLTEKNAIESEISKSLNMPISTIHYNMQQLLKAGLVEAKGFYYSSKGNKINVYTLAKKIILISPKGVNIKKNKIRGILPAIVAGIAGTIFIKWFFSSNFFKASQIIQETANGKAAPLMTAAGEKAAAINFVALSTNYALFFAAGVAITLFILLILNITEGKQKREEKKMKTENIIKEKQELNISERKK